jgi:hypothetical protein
MRTKNTVVTVVTAPPSGQFRSLACHRPRTSGSPARSSALRRLTLRLLGGTLAFLLASPLAGFADQVFHTARLPFVLTSEGAAVGHPALRSGQVIDIHPNGPVNGAHERYMINGAQANTEYDVVLRIFDGDYAGAPDPDFDMLMTTTLTTDQHGNAHGKFTFPAGAPLPEPIFFGVLWTLIDVNGVVAYDTECILVGID